jgi:tRNA isopentenyl-2-thiomethyl-A-37 hydroxylase MiaE
VNLEPRIAAFAALEAQLITSPDAVFRFHSGPPADGTPARGARSNN